MRNCRQCSNCLGRRLVEIPLCRHPDAGIRPAKIAPQTHDAFRFDSPKTGYQPSIRSLPSWWWQELPSTTTGGSQNLSPTLGALGYNIEIFGSPSLTRSVPEFPMVRWVAFDDDTAEAVVSRLRRGAAEIQHNMPVDAALRAEGPSVLVLPSHNPGRLLIARFSPRKDAQLPTTNARTARPVPPAPSKPAASARKPWWRKLVA